MTAQGAFFSLNTEFKSGKRILNGYLQRWLHGEGT